MTDSPRPNGRPRKPRAIPIAKRPKPQRKQQVNLTNEEWDEIEKLVSQDLTLVEIAKTYNITPAAISNHMRFTVKPLKELANGIVSCQAELMRLPERKQEKVLSLVETMTKVSHNLASAANSGAEVAAILNTLAVKKARQIVTSKGDDITKMIDINIVDRHLKVANTAAFIPLSLMSSKGNALQDSEKPLTLKDMLEKAEKKP